MVQQNFLANEKNKTKLIELLVETLTARTTEASTAIGDSDGSIVRCDLNKVTSHLSVVVIGDDVDLLVLLTALTPPDRNVYFMKPGRGNIEDKIYSTRQVQEVPFSGSILFSHSFTGCDTTCAIFNKNKLTILKCFLKMPNETKAIADIFYDPTSTPDAVAQAGEKMFLTLYQAPLSELIQLLREILHQDMNAGRQVSHCSSVCGCDGACMNSAQIRKEGVEED
ncbi:hypothetical protein PR048_006401 [Dryococelus australis]|uniref:Uncharacterized protein n=1 Tax=Dryococelus australis TaxID=614101 RepID=A0ABQ9IC72_9NEOP|nr:hypothetical protein PR048_006401 [Dryococelus australis]